MSHVRPALGETFRYLTANRPIVPPIIVLLLNGGDSRPTSSYALTLQMSKGIIKPVMTENTSRSEPIIYHQSRAGDQERID